MRSRLAVSAIAAVLTTVVVYAVLRAFAALFGHEPDPALVIWSEHAAMFWRLGIGAYAAGAAAFCVFLATGASPEATTRWVLRAVLPVAVLVTLQGVFLP